MVEYVIFYLATLRCWTFSSFSLCCYLRQHYYEYFKPVSLHTGPNYFLRMIPKRWDCSIKRGSSRQQHTIMPVCLQHHQHWAFPLLNLHCFCDTQVWLESVSWGSLAGTRLRFWICLCWEHWVSARAEFSLYLLFPAVLIPSVYCRVQTYQSGCSQSWRWIWLWWAFDEDRSSRAQISGELHTPEWWVSG